MAGECEGGLAWGKAWRGQGEGHWERLGEGQGIGLGGGWERGNGMGWEGSRHGVEVRGCAGGTD
jgi:hypothetical protein